MKLVSEMVVWAEALSWLSKTNHATAAFQAFFTTQFPIPLNNPKYKTWLTVWPVGTNSEFTIPFASKKQMSVVFTWRAYYVRGEDGALQ